MLETVIIISIIFVFLSLTIVRRPKHFPPGPLHFPIIGSIPSLDYRNSQKSWDEFGKKYGDLTGVVVPNFKLIIVNGWNSIKEVLGNDSILGRNDVCLLRDRFDGGRYGLLFTDGELWRTNRRFVLHHFRNLGFGRKHHEAIVLEEAQSIADQIELMNGTLIHLEPQFAIAAINIVWHLIGGERFHSNDPKLIQLVEDVKNVVHSVQINGSPAVMFPFTRYIFPTLTGYRSLRKGSAGILQFIRRAVAERENNNCRPDVNPENLLDIYKSKITEEAKNKDSQFSMEQLEGICVDLLSAGSDTSSSVLSFAIMFLCLKPKMQEKMHEEILNNIGAQRLPTYDDRIMLSYAEAFLNEVMRYRAPVPTFPPHVAMTDTEFMGYKIEKNTVFIVNAKSIYMDENYWIDPENFRPERFLNDDEKFCRDERMISFGKGKRSCLGETLAKMSSLLILVYLVQRFKFAFPNGEIPKDTSGIPGFTVAPPFYRVIATPR